MLRSLIISSLAAVLVAGLAYAQQAPLAIKRTPLGKVDVPGSNYEVIFGIAELSPGPRQDGIPIQARCWLTCQRAGSGI